MSSVKSVHDRGGGGAGDGDGGGGGGSGLHVAGGRRNSKQAAPNQKGLVGLQMLDWRRMKRLLIRQIKCWSLLGCMSMFLEPCSMLCNRRGLFCLLLELCASPASTSAAARANLSSNACGIAILAQRAKGHHHGAAEEC